MRKLTFYTAHQRLQILLVVAVLLACSGIALAQEPERERPEPTDTARLQAQANTMFDDDSVLPTRLQLLAAEYAQYERSVADLERDAVPPPFESALGASVRGPGGYIILEVDTTGDAPGVLQALESLGLVSGGAYQSRVSGLLPISNLPAVDRIAGIRSVSTNEYATRVGIVTSQADSGMDVNIARNAYGLDGSGVTVGVLSDSYDCYSNPRGENAQAVPLRSPDAAEDISTGDLKAPTFVQEPGTCVGGTDEGRALMQLILDLAPGVDLQFHTANGGEAAFAAGIQELQSEGSDIIVDDIIYFGEAFFQDDLIAQSANSVVNGGVPFFSAAGNEGSDYYVEPFRNSGVNWVVPPTDQVEGFACATLNDTYRLHDFDPGPGVDTRARFTDPGNPDPNVPNDGVRFYLQWDDAHGSISGGSPVDSYVSYFIVRAGTNIIVDCGDDFFAAGPNDPIQFGFGTDGTGAQYDMIVGYRVGPERSDPPSYLALYNVGTRIQTEEYLSGRPTLFGHANAVNVAAVGAVDYRFPTFPASFTALGGIPIFFNSIGQRLPTPVVRTQPRFAAEQNTDTTFFIPGRDIDNNGFPNFSGTSAAAPHAAAIAALIKECDPSLTPAQIYNAMSQTAVDISTAPAAPGYDFYTGAGVIDADAALERIAIEIDLKGNGTAIPDGSIATSVQNSTDFGTLRVSGQANTNSFVIFNATPNCGFIQLTGSPAVQITGPNAVDFEVVLQPSDTDIRSDELGTTFFIRFNPTKAGIREATVRFNNNDPDEGVYTFKIRGLGLPDFNGDNRVTPQDVVVVTNRVGDSSAVAQYDLNNDGVVNILDVEIVIGQLGQTA